MIKVLAAAAGVICIGAGHPAPRPLEVVGEIALTDTPFCEFFVVRTASGFSLLWWRGGMLVFAEGDRVIGALESVGLSEIEHVLEPRLAAAIGPLKTSVRVEASGSGLRAAQGAYYLHCREPNGGGTLTH